jgi:hypothetical protein
VQWQDFAGTSTTTYNQLVSDYKPPFVYFSRSMNVVENQFDDASSSHLQKIIGAHPLQPYHFFIQPALFPALENNQAVLFFVHKSAR